MYNQTKKRIRFFSFFFLLFSLPLFAEDESPPLLGLVVEVLGKACVERKEQESKCLPLQRGTRIYHGDILSIKKEGRQEARVALLDWGTKNRLLIPEGKYLLSFFLQEKPSMLSQVMSRIQKILGATSIPTGVSNLRGESGEIHQCTLNEVFPAFRSYEPKKQSYLFQPLWLNQCLEKFKIDNQQAIPELGVEGKKLPPFSSYLQIPENMRSQPGEGKWILAQQSSCAIYENTSLSKQSFSSLLQIAPVSYLVWPYQGGFPYFGFAQTTKSCREQMQKKIKEAQGFWADPENLEYLWFIADFYRENGFHHQEILILKKIAEKSAPNKRDEILTTVEKLLQSKTILTGVSNQR